MKKQKATTTQKPKKATGFKEFPNRLFTLSDSNPIHKEIFNAAKKGLTK